MDYLDIRSLTDPAKLESLANSDDYYTLMEVVKNPYTPEPVLVKLASEGSEQVAALTVRTQNFPAKAAINLIVNGASSFVMMAAAEHPGVPVELLLKLAIETNDDRIISSVVNNPAATFEVIEAALKNKKAYDVAYPDLGARVLAGNKTTPSAVLDLIHRLKPHLAYDVANNRNASPALLDAIARQDLTGEDAVYPADAYRAVAKHKNALPSTLEFLSKHSDVWVRTKIAWNPITDDHVLIELSDDREPAVRKAVAKNKHTPESILRKLENDKSSQVRAGVAENRLKNSRP